jgi:hypothetical protein
MVYFMLFAMKLAWARGAGRQAVGRAFTSSKPVKTVGIVYASMGDEQVSAANPKN